MLIKSNFVRWLINFAISATFISAVPIEAWVTEQGHVGREKFSVQFPESPQNKSSDRQITLYAHETGAMYVVTAPNPALNHDDADKAFAIFRKVNGEPPKQITHWVVYEKDGNHTMDLETYNTQTMHKTKVRYIATKNNIWQLKTVYEDDNEHQHDEFVNSFKLSQ